MLPEQDLGRWPGLVSVGSADRGWQEFGCQSSLEGPRLLIGQVIPTEPEVAYQGQIMSCGGAQSSHLTEDHLRPMIPLRGGPQGQSGGV